MQHRNLLNACGTARSVPSVAALVLATLALQGCSRPDSDPASNAEQATRSNQVAVEGGLLEGVVDTSDVGPSAGDPFLDRPPSICGY